MTQLPVPTPEALEPFWMPFTANRSFKGRPRLFTQARGMYYRTVDGRQVLDGIAGLWCVDAGHAQGHEPQHVFVQTQLTFHFGDRGRGRV